MWRNKGADQLRGYREADLRLCFRICKKLVFSRHGSFEPPHALFVCLFDLMLYVHGKQLRSCWDGHLLNHTGGILPVSSAHSFASN